MTKSKERSKSYLTTIDFDNIDMRDIKYLQPHFYGDVLFMLFSISMGVSNAYGCSMDDMDKMCNSHLSA